MAIKTQIVRQGLRWYKSALETILLPSELGITKIIISGTEVSDCSETRTGNMTIDHLRMRINNLLMMEWNATIRTATQENWGIMLLKEFYLQKHLVAMPTDVLIIDFPTPLPKNAKLELLIKMSSLAQCGCSTDDLNFTYDILVEYDDAYKGATLTPYITYETFVITAGTGHLFHYIKPLPKPLRAIIMVTEDQNTAVVDGVDSLTIKDPYKVYFDGKMTELEAQQEGKSKLALTTGYFIFQFVGGIKVLPNTLLMDFYNAAGGTTIEIHFLYICY